MTTEPQDTTPEQLATSADPGLAYLGPRANLDQDDLAASEKLDDLPVPGPPDEGTADVAGGNDPDLDPTHNVLTDDEAGAGD